MGNLLAAAIIPDCHFLEPLEKPKDTDVQCPECHQGTYFATQIAARKNILFLFALSGL